MRLLFALAAEKDWLVDHVDIEAAFLHGDVQEEIYIEQPENFILEGSESKVCKLSKAIYGLKQAAKCWYEKAKRIMMELNFCKFEHEPCVFYKFVNREVIIVTMCVDDFIIFSSRQDEMSKLKRGLKERLDVRDLGPMDDSPLGRP